MFAYVVISKYMLGTPIFSNKVFNILYYTGCQMHWNLTIIISQQQAYSFGKKYEV